MAKLFYAKLDSLAHYYLLPGWQRTRRNVHAEAMVFTPSALTVSVIEVLHSGMLKGSTRQYHTFHGEYMATAR